MTSKEKIQKLKMSLYNSNVDVRIIMAQQDILCDIEKDLEELEELKKIMGTPIQEIREKLKKLEYYENENYKHWNIFFNGAKLEYLLYLEKKGKESFMTSIPEELFSKIKEHFSDGEGA